jgi:hypothetical protein
VQNSKMSVEEKSEDSFDSGMRIWECHLSGVPG